MKEFWNPARKTGGGTGNKNARRTPYENKKYQSLIQQPLFPWNTIQLIFTAIGGWLGWFLGGCDGLLYALVVFVVGLFHRHPAHR